MALSSGTKLGPYEIQSPLGAGGMGEVYRARDTRLGRDVAIKVLPEALAKDADRLRRFEQEARTIATLNHPNILGIHDIGAHEGAPLLVSELLEGQTLRETFETGPLPVRRARVYERLSGKRVLKGDRTGETMTAILREESRELNGTAWQGPPALQRILVRCLEKNVERRFQSASDLAFAIDSLSGTSSGSSASPTTRSLQPPKGRSSLPCAATA